MGWSAEHLDAPFSASRKREFCDLQFSEGCTVVRSAMVGSVYYAALRDEETGRVFGVVTLTRIDNSDWYNFWTKSITEDMGPVDSRCPKCILDCLSETNNEYALKWRKACLEYDENSRTLKSLPMGSEICRDGAKYRKERHGKRTLWINTKKGTYLPAAELAELGFCVCDD